MNCPNIYNVDKLVAGSQQMMCGLSDGRWVEARPSGYYGLCLFARLKLAWLVFTGKADVLTWTEQ